MLISTALLLDSIIRNSVCTPAKLPCRGVEVGYAIIIIIRVFEIMRGEFDSVWTTMENILSSFCENLFFDLGVI
jgi:hypothetical protein